MYIADYLNNRIRKVVVSTGIVSTIAGTGASSYSGDGGAATSADINYPTDIATDTSGIQYTFLVCHLFILFIQATCTSLIRLTIVSVR